MSRNAPRSPARADPPAMTSGGRTSQRPARARAGQQGLALVLLLALVSMGALYMLVAQLGRATQRADRDLVTMSVLSEAKQALIGYAAREKRLRPRPLPIITLDLS
jgi:hypothetical protein